MKYIKSFDTTAELNEYLQTTENTYYVLEDKEADSLTYLKPEINTSNSISS